MPGFSPENDQNEKLSFTHLVNFYFKKNFEKNFVFEGNFIIVKKDYSSLESEEIYRMFRYNILNILIDIVENFKVNNYKPNTLFEFLNNDFLNELKKVVNKYHKVYEESRKKYILFDIMFDSGLIIVWENVMRYLNSHRKEKYHKFDLEELLFFLRNELTKNTSINQQ